MTEKKAYQTIVENASPYITLTHVLDEKGDILVMFQFHPQMNEVGLSVEFLKEKQIPLTTDDVRCFAKQLIEFCEFADTVVNSYNK